MKKFLSIIGSIGLLSSTTATISFAVSCSPSPKKYHKTDIQTDSEELDLIINKKDYITILNIDDLKNLRVDLKNNKELTYKIEKNKLYFVGKKAFDQTVILIADNANKTIPIKLSCKAIVQEALPKLSQLLKIAYDLFPSFAKDDDIAKKITSIIDSNKHLLSVFGILASIKSRESLLDDSQISLINRSLDLSLYKDMNYSEGIKATQIRIANATSLLCGSIKISDIITWTDKDKLENNLTNSLNTLGSTIKNLIDKKNINYYDSNSKTYNYAIGELIGSFNFIGMYLSNFEISTKDIEFSQIQDVLSTSVNIKTKGINLSELMGVLSGETLNEVTIKNILKILFAQSDSVGNKEGEYLIDLTSSKDTKSLTYANIAFAPLLQSIIFGVNNSQKVFNMIKSKIPSFAKLVITDDVIKNSLSNCLPRLLTYLSNGWNPDNVKIRVKILVPIDKSLKDILNMLSGKIPPDSFKLIQNVLNDPLGFIINLVKSKNNGVIFSLPLEDIFKFLNLDADLDQILGEIKNCKIGKVFFTIYNSLKENDLNINFYDISRQISILTQKTSDDEYLINYLLKNVSEIGDSKSLFWKNLGLDAENGKLTEGSILQIQENDLESDTTRNNLLAWSKLFASIYKLY